MEYNNELNLQAEYGYQDGYSEQQSEDDSDYEFPEEN